MFTFFFNQARQRCCNHPPLTDAQQELAYKTEAGVSSISFIFLTGFSLSSIGNPVVLVPLLFTSIIDTSFAVAGARNANQRQNQARVPLMEVNIQAA